MKKKVTKLSKFNDLYKDKIKERSWITKDDLTDKGFFSKSNSNGKDIRFIKSKYDIEEYREGNRITRFRIIGNKKSTSTRVIRKDIMDDIKKKRCSLLSTSSNVEVDHKNGRYNDKRVLERDTQTPDDFQPLSKVVNNIKREACKKCTITGKRFDAKEHGYLVSTLNGEEAHNETPDGCNGCFFFDIDHFKDSHNDILSKNFGPNNPFNEKDFHILYKEKHT